MAVSTAGPGTSPLITLEGIGRPRSVWAGKAVEQVRKAIANALGTASCPVLWLEGPAGIGKTTSVVSALTTSPGLRGVRHIACFPGRRLEEILYPISDFLCQIGSQHLRRVLGQRVPLEAKLAVLGKSLAREPIVLWLDDFHDLDAGNGENRDEVLNLFVRLISRLGGDARGVLLISSEKPPPADGRVEALEHPRLQPEESRALWKTLFNGMPASRERDGDLGEMSRELTASPLALRLLRQLVAHGNAELLAQLTRSRREPVQLEDLCRLVTKHLAPEDLRLLELLAAYRGPLSRKALRELSPEESMGPATDLSSCDRRALHLAETGCVTAASGENGRLESVWIHPLVRDVVSRDVASRAPSEWTGILSKIADYHVGLHRRCGGVWHLCRARRIYFEAGHHSQAFDVHRHFVEEFLKLGFLDLACLVLTQTVSTTTGQNRAVALGNLAIVRKNRSDYDGALELYEEAYREFESLGDLPNLARVLHQLGNTRLLKGEVQDAIGCYRRSLELSTDLGDSIIASATRIQIGNALFHQRELDAALEFYEKVAEDLDPKSNGGILAAVRLQTGQIHYHARRYLDSEAHLREAAQFARECNDRRTLLKVLKAQALLLRDLREYDEAAAKYGEARVISEELGDHLEWAVCQLLEGDLERSRAQLGRSLRCYLSAHAALAKHGPARSERSEDGAGIQRSLEERLDDTARLMGKEAFQRALPSDLPLPPRLAADD